MLNDIHARSRQTFVRIPPTKFRQPPQRHTNNKPLLLVLPPELLLNILGHLQDLDDLFSTILSCRQIFAIFQGSQRPLIESSFTKCVRQNTDQGIYRTLIQLRRIIQRDMVHRNVVRHVFETGWEIFRKRHQEELLIPFGRALAWSYVLNNRLADAVPLLRLIQEGESPFRWSTRILSQQPIQPIRELLEQLVPEENSVDRKHISLDLDHPLVEIKSKSKKGVFRLSHIEQSTVLKDGILFRKDSIVMRKRTSYPQTFHPQPTFHYAFFRHSSVSHETMNRDVMKILAHGPTGSYVRGGGTGLDSRNL